MAGPPKPQRVVTRRGFALLSLQLALIGGLGWYLGGLRLALIVCGFVLFIAFSGFWPRALITAYMVSFAVLVCVAIGFPLGVWAARTDGRAAAVQVLCDTFQTFPSFIYLLPVIMLFQVGDVAAIAAEATEESGTGTMGPL